MPPRMAPIIEIPVITERCDGPKCHWPFEEGGIHVLRAVRREVHHRHQERQIQEQLPVRCDGAPQPPQLSSRLFFQTSDSFTRKRTNKASSAGNPPRKNSGRQPQRWNNKK